MSVTTAAGDAQREPVVRWGVNELVALVPGTTRRMWLYEMIPSLVAQGVLRKAGRAWFARRGEIENALLGRNEQRRRGR